MTRKTPEKLSPYFLIQEFLRSEPWHLLCAVVMLNQTSAKQVWKVWPVFHRLYRNPEDFLLANEHEVLDLIKPLGFKSRRYERLLGMTLGYLAGFTDVTTLYGIGKYGADSFRIFVEGYLVEDVLDKELKNYVAWAKEDNITGAGDGND